MKSFLHVVMLENNAAKVSATDDDWFTILCKGDVDVTVSMRPDVADRICTALGQLLTDRYVRKHGTPDQLSEVIADQVERAELLADAPGVGCTQTDAADIMDSLAHTNAPHTSAADMSEGELILGRRVPPQ